MYLSFSLIRAEAMEQNAAIVIRLPTVIRECMLRLAYGTITIIFNHKPIVQTVQ